MGRLLFLLSLSINVVAQNETYYSYDNFNRVIQTKNSYRCSKVNYTYDNDGNRTTTLRSQILTTQTITNNPCFGGHTGSISLQATSNYTYQWSNNRTGPVNSNLPAGTYTVTITDETLSNTCIKSYAVKESAPLAVNIITQNINCHGARTGVARADTSNLSLSGLRFTWPDGSHGLQTQNLAAGTYSLSITDSATTCTQTFPFHITQAPTFITNIINDSISCYGANDGYAAISVAGNIADYTFHWSSGSTANSENHLGPGPKVITVTDTLTYCTEQLVLNIFEPSQIQTTAQIQPSCNNSPTGSIVLSATGGIPPYKYSFDSSGYQSVNNFNSLASNVYQTITRDHNYCTDTAFYAVPSEICNTGISSINDSSFLKVYPSPNSGEFYIEFTNPMNTSATIKITTISGQVVLMMAKNFESGTEKIPVDLKKESTGIYFVEVKTSGYSATKQIEVIH